MDKKDNKNNVTTLPFIKTSDEETKILLESEGCNLIDFSNGVWTFINTSNQKIKFSEEVSEKIVYTNMLCI